MLAFIVAAMGVLALLSGKFPLTRSRAVEGWSSRLVGLVLIIPLLTTMALNLEPATRTGVDPGDMGLILLQGSPATLALLVLCLLGAFGIAVATAKSHRKRGQPDDEAAYPRRRRSGSDLYDEDEARPNRSPDERIQE